MNHLFRLVGMVLTLAIGATCARGAGSIGWPTHPVRVIVPFGSGTGPDMVTRLLAPALSERWQQPVVIDNRPGADGLVGVQAFVSANDDHSLLFMPAAQVTLSALLHEHLPFDPEQHVVPVAGAVAPSIGIAVAKGLQVTSPADLAARLRSQPGLLWGSAPGLPDIIFKAFLALEQVSMKHVPYRDQSMAMHDLGNGRIHAFAASVTSLSPMLQSGAARLIVVATSSRIAAAPDVPTMSEAGYPSLAIDGTWGFYGRRAITSMLRDRISEDVRAALGDASLHNRLVAMGLTVAPANANAFAADVDRQRGQIYYIANLIGLKPTVTPP